MAYLGNAPARNFISFERQVFTIVNSQTAYTLDHSVTNENDIRLVINNVVQEPGSGKAYTASGTTLTLSAALTNGTDEMYCVFLGRAVATQTPAAGSVGTSQLTGNLVTPGTLDVNGNELILDADADSSITADTDDTIHVKTGGSDRVTVNDTGLAIGTTPEAPLTVGSNNSGGQGVVGKQALFSGTNTSTYNAGNSGTWGGITIVNQDNTSNRTGTGITFVNRSSSSGLAGIQSTNDGTAERADLRFITRGAGGTVAERMRIDDDGHVICPVGITLGTAVGTYNAANTMDDYEEGTWTPGFTNFSGSGGESGPTSPEGYYTKIGDLVFASFYVAVPANGDSSAINISSLPFSAKDVPTMQFGGSITRTDAAFSVSLATVVSDNSNYIHVTRSTSSANLVPYQDVTGKFLTGIVVYKTA